MAMNMDAMLRITARATGGEQVQALGKKIQQVEGVTKRLTSASGLLGGALGALAPVATIGGIGALVQKTIAAGDAMYDMSQRTGVSVEALARFKKAAATSGTDIDAVSKALGKLSKGMYEAAQSGKGPTAEALKALGISATDAAGKLKTADQVTLEISNKFKAMPDGVEKTALAMQLFGKAGAKQATEYVNWVFNRDNEGVIILHDWFKDALLQKVGVVKAYWEDKEDVVIPTSSEFKLQNLKGHIPDAVIAQIPDTAKKF